MCIKCLPDDLTRAGPDVPAQLLSAAARQRPETLPLAAVEDVVLHAMSCLAPPASTAIATSAMRLHGIPLKLLKDQLTADRSGQVRKALHELDLRAESIVEVDAQHLFRANGVGYDAQVYLPGIGRVDFLIEGFLIVPAPADFRGSPLPAGGQGASNRAGTQPALRSPARRGPEA